MSLYGWLYALTQTFGGPLGDMINIHMSPDGSIYAKTWTFGGHNLHHIKYMSSGYGSVLDGYSQLWRATNCPVFDLYNLFRYGGYIGGLCRL